MSKQTAVEWLTDEINKLLYFTPDSETDLWLKRIIKEAKAMEDEQIKSAYKTDRRVINLFDERELNMKAMDYLDRLKGRL